MSYSIQRETSDGTLGTIDLTIEYIDQTDISVYVDDVIIDKVGGSTPYLWDWIDADSISITPDVADGLVAMVKRSTPFDALYHIFTDSAVFSDRSMDENFRQVLYLSQEAIEGQGATDFYSNLDLHGYIIKNSGTAVDADDLVSLGQYQADASGAYQSRLGSEAARNAALVSKNAASASALASANSAAASLVSENASEVSRLASEAARDISVSSASAANADAISAAASWDSFDDVYLGAKSSDPTLDNDGDALATGALYYNSTSSTLKVYNGSAWVPTYLSTDGDVIGPASSALNYPALFDGVTGKLLKQGSAPIGTAAYSDTTAFATPASVALKANITSPALAGVPTAPTAALATDTTQIATTEFVHDNLAGYLPLAGGTVTGLITAPAFSGTAFSGNVFPTKVQALASTTVQVVNGAYMTYTATGANTWTFGDALLNTTDYEVCWKLELTNGGLGAQTFTDVVWQGGVPPTLLASGTDILTFTRVKGVTRGSYSGAGAYAIGVGQTWQNVTGSRAFGTLYTNTTGKPIMVSVYTTQATDSDDIQLLIGGVSVGITQVGGGTGSRLNVSGVVPNGATYQIVAPGRAIGSWAELR